MQSANQVTQLIIFDVMLKKYITALTIAILAISCGTHEKTAVPGERLDSIATEYVKLGLSIGQFDGDFVDAYYGPDSLRPAETDTSRFPKEALLQKTAALKQALATFATDVAPDTLARRAEWLTAQLTAFERRILLFSGTIVPFDSESGELFDAVAPVYKEKYFQDLVAKLDRLLPGQGPIPERFQKLANHFLIPGNKIDTVFRIAIAEARKRTLAHYTLPVNEDFKLEYVRDKPWSGYNWYKGNYKSVIQINVSQPIYIERAIDLACHEGYPGHHVYNVLLEKNLFRDKGWTEISLYPLFSPQSLIAEGSANYGISMAFPGNEQREFCKTVLIPLAGLDTAMSNAYFEALTIRSALNYARNEVARGLLDNGMSEQEAKRWLTGYCLLPDKGASDYLRFIRKYRSYVINYNYGQEIVRKYIGSQGGTAADTGKRWKLFEALLSNENKASDLLKK
jgi:hypothetical protein